MKKEKEKEKEKEVEKYEEIMKRVSEYLAIKMGTSAINLSYDRTSKDGSQVIWKTPETSDSELFGIFKRMIKTAVVEVKIDKCDDGVLIIRPTFYYEHHDGGSNGHRFDSSLKYENEVLSEI